jgi:hypothetical protein
MSTADYATDYIKIKDLALKKESKQLGLGLKRKLRKLTLKYLVNTEIVTLPTTG